ncbi:hypothetical protein D5086_015364 [Populus alba]|uniref:Uncharacterized protein n=2 Tax=Populus TaxID=3689 RepID=A0ACC4C053_POPAL|nr:hypothetical protein NC653_019404 [Populus alba x Populus x berolinensis]
MYYQPRASGLPSVDRSGTRPFYVGQEPLAAVVSRGLAVIFAPRNPEETIISEGTEFSTVTFSASSTFVQNSTWSISREEDSETSRRFIVIFFSIYYLEYSKFNRSKREKDQETTKQSNNQRMQLCLHTS